MCVVDSSPRRWRASVIRGGAGRPSATSASAMTAGGGGGEGCRTSFIFSIGRRIYDSLVELSARTGLHYHAVGALNACWRAAPRTRGTRTMMASRLMRRPCRQLYCFRRRPYSSASAVLIRRQSGSWRPASMRRRPLRVRRPAGANQDRNYTSYPSVNPSYMFVINRAGGRHASLRPRRPDLETGAERRMRACGPRVMRACQQSPIDRLLLLLVGAGDRDIGLYSTTAVTSCRLTS